MATEFAVRKCPFLASVAQREGEEFAASIARDATRPVGRGCLGPLLPDEDDVLSQFGMFHGPQGVCPLSGFEQRAHSLAQRCPFRRADDDSQAVVAPKAPPALPLASMGMSFGPGVSFHHRHRRRRAAARP